MIRTALFAAATLMAAPAVADDLVAEGQELVAKRCKSCHMIADGDNVILKGGKTGPNLYGVIGRQVGAVEDFKYGKDHAALGETGLVWDEANIAAFLENPRDFLKEQLNADKAKSKMSFKLKKEEDRAAVVAYLASLNAE